MESSDFDVKRYARLIHKRRYVFLLIVLSVITAVTFTSYLLPKEYEAKCTVFIERGMINSLIKGIAVTPSLDDRLKIISYTMSSRGLLLKVVDDLGIPVKKGDHSAIESLIAGFRNNTDVRMKSENDLFTVSYRNRDPRFARDYVNTLVRRYIEENISEKREETYGASRFLSEQIKFFKEKLDKADEEIIKFRKERGVFVALDDRKIVEELKSSEEALDEIRIKRKELDARKGQVMKHMKSERPYTAAILGKGMGDPNERVLMLRKRLTELLLMYTPNYPEVIRVRAELEALKAQMQGNTGTVPEDIRTADAEMSTLNPLYQSLKEELSKTELELAALTGKEEQIRRLTESKKMYLKSMPVEKKNLTDLEMQRATAKNIYEELIARLSQSEVSKQMEVQDKAATFKIVDPAVTPARPVSPDRARIILTGIIAGFGMAFGTITLLDYIDKSVKNVEALRALGLPVLAVIPSIRDENKVMEIRKKDILLYKAAGAYMFCILAVLAVELLGLTFIDDFIGAVTGFPGRLLELMRK